jgi:hypothetical protein
MATHQRGEAVLKKVGIVAAVATAGVLALSPLAFAGDKDGHGDRDRGGNQTNSFSFEDESVERNQVNLCSFDQEATALPATVVGAILPSVFQDQNDNCVNVGDGSEYGPEPEPVLPPVIG